MRAALLLESALCAVQGALLRLMSGHAEDRCKAVEIERGCTVSPFGYMPLIRVTILLRSKPGPGQANPKAPRAAEARSATRRTALRVADLPPSVEESTAP